MPTAIWPTPNSAADALLVRLLEKVLPDWKRRAVQELTGYDVAEFLWDVIAPLKGRAAPTAQPLAEIEVDASLAALAEGADFSFDRLSSAAQDVFHARLLVALAGAMVAGAEGNAVMLLPLGLPEAERSRAVLVRLLYQAPLSIEGLD
ncbi:hypothetical protein [Phenylobacterium sp.]|uniref:hypothetical protein n=1 Tax=Phenylobacterium sp. TaxID=1871053 RepID=UPI00272F50E9|nr:hypothetical protein [Phenylobacterium sp.]MDP1617306.1 hypothetical protein [Phenylobacterium sp.]MDP1985678.1 hypothetical protein [Phenylobacterium sp.]